MGRGERGQDPGRGHEVSEGDAPEQPPVGASGGSYSGLPPSGDFDQLTREAGGLSRRSMLRLGGAAIIAGLVAWFLWGRGGSRCTTASRCGDRHYCDEDETCICTETAEGDIRCGQLPPYCDVPLCTTSADCAHLGEGFFCDTPNSGCCNDRELSRCIAPCGSEYPPRPTTTTTSTTAPPEDGPDEPEDDVDDPDDGEPAHLRRTATQPDGVLFFTRREDGSAAYFYGEEESDGSLVPTHVVFEDDDGVLATVIVNGDMLPVNWIVAELSVAARPESRGAVLDPVDALHSVIVGSEEWLLRTNLVPKDLAAALAEAEDLVGERLPDARRVVQQSDGWVALVAAAREAGDDQPQHIANALGLSIAHAVAVLLAAADEVEIEVDGDDEGDDEDAAATPQDRVLPVSAPAAITPIYKLLGELLGPLLESMVKNALLNMGLDPLSPKTPTDPRVPTFDLLLCQGATRYGTVCHYTFFDRRNAAACIDFCKTDLSCFTNICMPITLAASDVIQTW